MELDIELSASSGELLHRSRWTGAIYLHVPSGRLRQESVKIVTEAIDERRVVYRIEGDRNSSWKLLAPAAQR